MKIHTRKHWLLLAAICAAGGTAFAGSAAPSQYSFRNPGAVTAIVLLPNSATLISASMPSQWKLNPRSHRQEGSLSAWSTSTGKVTKRLYQRGVLLSFASDAKGRYLVGSGYSLVGRFQTPVIQVWHTDPLRLKYQLSGGQFDGGIAISRDGVMMAIGGFVKDAEGGQAVFLYDAATGKLMKTLRGFKWGRVRAIAFSSDGRSVAAVAVSKETAGGEVCIWDVATARRTHWLRDAEDGGSPDYHGPLAFIEDGKTLACGESLITLSGKTAVRLMLAVGDRVCISLCPGRPMLALFSVSTYRSRLELWDVARRKLLRTWSVADTYGIAAAFSLDGTLLALSDKPGRIEITLTRTGRKQ